MLLFHTADFQSIFYLSVFLSVFCLSVCLFPYSSIASLLWRVCPRSYYENTIICSRLLLFKHTFKGYCIGHYFSKHISFLLNLVIEIYYTEKRSKKDSLWPKNVLIRYMDKLYENISLFSFFYFTVFNRLHLCFDQKFIF